MSEDSRMYAIDIEERRRAVVRLRSARYEPCATCGAASEAPVCAACGGACAEVPPVADGRDAIDAEFGWMPYGKYLPLIGELSALGRKLHDSLDSGGYDYAALQRLHEINREIVALGVRRWADGQGLGAAVLVEYDYHGDKAHRLDGPSINRLETRGAIAALSAKVQWFLSLTGEEKKS